MEKKIRSPFITSIIYFFFFINGSHFSFLFQGLLNNDYHKLYKYRHEYTENRHKEKKTQFYGFKVSHLSGFVTII